MAAEIQQGTATRAGISRKPELINKLQGHSNDVNMAIFIPTEDGVISVSDDRTVRVWLKRDTGQYWPSICHTLTSAASCLDFNEETKRLFIGMESGTISEFVIAEDFNRMSHVRNYLAHQGRVSAVKFSLGQEWLLSCGRDKYFQWHCSETGRRLGGVQAEAWCTCIEYDAQSRHAFVGDYSGQIMVLKISNTGSEMVTTLKGHSGSVRCLAWDEDRSLLFSGSFDQSIITWDIGGQKGSAIELQGHRDKVQAVYYIPLCKQLVGGGDDSILSFWDMDVQRTETPEWAENDSCEKCTAPFFWNFKTMWETKSVGVRQHHCRKCGAAVCAKCSEKRTTMPLMGHEKEVRVCDKCFDTVNPEDKAPLATFHDAHHAVVYIDFDRRRKSMLTVGKDRIIKLWDVSSVLH